MHAMITEEKRAISLKVDCDGRIWREEREGRERRREKGGEESGIKIN